MKVLVTGASGFVGSHVLEGLSERGRAVAVLLRPTSSRKFIPSHLSLDIREGSILEPESLRKALDGITHVIHCAGCVKASRLDQFYEVNQIGTRNLVAAVNATAGAVKRFVHISSLAAAGPGTPEHPARETESSQPVSEYGKSKLAGELELRSLRDTPCVILRPPAVYGPRDMAFLPLFKAVQRHLLPLSNPRQALSVVYVVDLADAVAHCAEHPAAAGKTFFVAGGETVTANQMAREIASQTGVWTIPCPLPAAVLWPICLGSEISSRLTGRAHILSLQKFAELRAPGWVCDGRSLQQETGCECPTTLARGIGLTLEWYRRQNWL